MIVNTDPEVEPLNKSHRTFMRANKAMLESVFPLDKVLLLEEFLAKPHTTFLRPTMHRSSGGNLTVFDMKSLLSGSNVTSDVLAQYQAMLGKNNPTI